MVIPLKCIIVPLKCILVPMYALIFYNATCRLCLSKAGGKEFFLNFSEYFCLDSVGVWHATSTVDFYGGSGETFLFLSTENSLDIEYSVTAHCIHTYISGTEQLS